MAQEVTLEELRMLARRAGLDLSDAELERVRPTLGRARAQAAALRELLGPGAEPAQVFAPLPGKKK